MKGLLFLIIGPSGVGKNTLICNILKTRKDIKFLASYSSRAIRENESQGQPYYFISKDEFQSMIIKGKFLEWKFVHGCYYGINKDKIEDLLQKGHNIITDIEVLGAMDVMHAFSHNCVSIYIDVPSEDDLVKRIKIRGKLNDVELEKRLRRVRFESLYRDHFDYLLYNVDMQNCLISLDKILDLQLLLYRQNSKYLSRQVLSYFLKLVIINENNNILLFRKKLDSVFYDFPWKIPSNYVLLHEYPQKTLNRIIYLFNIQFSLDEKKLFNKFQYLCQSNYQYSKEHICVDIAYFIEVETLLVKTYDIEYEFQWFNVNQLFSILNEKDQFIINYL